MTDSFVPFQPNVNDAGGANPAAGRDDAILYGATKPDPGGLPRGTIEHIELSDFYNVPGATFQATVHLRSGAGTLPAGKVELDVPAGWTAEPAKDVGPVSDTAEQTVTFDVTSDASAPVNSNFRIAALYKTGAMSGYTDNVVRDRLAGRGPLRALGQVGGVRQLAHATPPRARCGSAARRRRSRWASARRSRCRSTCTTGRPVAQSGDVSLALPAGFTADATTKSYGTLAPGADATVEFSLTNTDATLPANQTVAIPITTSYSAPAGSGSEELAISLVPTTAIPAAAAAPELDGSEAAGEYGGPALDVGKRWEGTACDPLGLDCGTAGERRRPGDQHVRQGHASRRRPVLLRPRPRRVPELRGQAGGVRRALARGLGRDPDRPARDRLADQHGHGVDVQARRLPVHRRPERLQRQRRQRAVLVARRRQPPGLLHRPAGGHDRRRAQRPRRRGRLERDWAGDNQTTTDHSYAGGAYDLEVKIPMAVLPAAVDPDRVGLNITPYDNDDNAATGTTTLRHIDAGQTRLSWSAFGSVQSDPYRWGHATVTGYTPPPDRPTTPPEPNVSNPNLDGVDSPETIHQSARNGVPISGRVPAPVGDRIAIAKPKLKPAAAELEITATGPGRARIFLWSGEKGYIPVWVTSCSPLDDPPPSYGLTACAETDGTVPPWSPDMSGRVIRDRIVSVTAGRHKVKIPLDGPAYAKLAAAGSALVSFETPADEVQALDVPLAPQGP